MNFYQRNIRLNIFGERSSYKLYGSWPAMVFSLFGAILMCYYLVHIVTSTFDK